MPKASIGVGLRAFNSLDEPRGVTRVPGSVKGVGGVIEAMFKKYAMKKGERLRVPWQLGYSRIRMKTGQESSKILIFRSSTCFGG